MYLHYFDYACKNTSNDIRVDDFEIFQFFSKNDFSSTKNRIISFSNDLRFFLEIGASNLWRYTKRVVSFIN